MNVAIFTDNDFDRVNGVTTALRAALHHAPRGLHLRVYTASALGVDAPNYLALISPGLPIPFCRDSSMYLPRVGAFMRNAREDRIDVVHVTTTGPVGLAALWVASKLGLPMIGTFHRDLAACAAVLSGSRRLGSLTRAYTRWLYGRCSRLLVPSEHARRLFAGARTKAARIDIWPGGVNTDLFSPGRRLSHLRERWHVADNRPALLYVGRVSREKGVGILPAIQDRLHALGIQHRFVIVGDGPMRKELRSRMPDAVFTGVLFGSVLAEAFASADFFVLPSHTDVAGSAVLEAQASGLPVAVFNAGAPCEYMVPGRTGVVCRSVEPALWAERIADDQFRRQSE